MSNCVIVDNMNVRWSAHIRETAAAVGALLILGACSQGASAGGGSDFLRVGTIAALLLTQRLSAFVSVMRPFQ